MSFNQAYCPHCGQYIDIPVAPEITEKKLDEIVWPEQNTRIRGVFQSLELKTVGDLLKKTYTDLRREPNCGTTSLRSIQHGLAQMGLTLTP